MIHKLLLTTVIFFYCKTEHTSASQLNLDRWSTDHTIQMNLAKVALVSSQPVGASLYKGTLDTSTPIWIYLNEQEHPCGGDLTIMDAMYSYDQKKWFLLDVTTNQEKSNYCLVEANFSGVYFLTVSKDKLSGTWISSDVKKQLNVVLQKTTLEDKANEKMQEILYDELLYNANDC